VRDSRKGRSRPLMMMLMLMKRIESPPRPSRFNPEVRRRIKDAHQLAVQADKVVQRRGRDAVGRGEVGSKSGTITWAIDRSGGSLALGSIGLRTHRTLRSSLSSSVPFQWR
jgi:hypothetical protein